MESNAATNQLSMWKYVFIAVAELFILNLVGKLILKIRIDISVVFVISMIIGYTISAWFAKLENRVPSSTEISRFLVKYAMLISFFFALLIYHVGHNPNKTIPTEWLCLSGFIDLTAYLLGAYFFLSGRHGRGIYKRYKQ